MANYWTFRNGATGELEERDIGSATLVEFIRANPSLGPVRRGRKDTPEVKFSMGGDSPSTYTPPAFAEEADPWSASATTPAPAPATPMPTDPQNANRYNDSGVYNWDEGARWGGGSTFAWQDPRGRQNPDAFATYAEREQFPDDPTGQRYDLSRDYSQETGGYSPSGTVGQSPVEGQVKQYGEYSPEDLEAQFEVNPNFDTPLTGEAYPEAIEEFQAVIKDLPPETQAKAGAFLQGISGPLFDETGNPIFPELPMDFLADLLKDPELSAYAGSIIETLLDSRSAVIQNATSNRAAVEQAQAQFNPFGRTAESDRSLQAMLARKQIEQTQAQFNPFGLTNRQGVQAIQDQFNPYAQDAEDRLALAQAQFNPYGQDATTRTDLIEAQFNPYDYNQTQGLQAITRQYNPYGFSQAQGLEGISRQFNPYGETAADRLALARMAQNPFERNQFEDQMLQESLARGGLSADQRLAEIRASNNPMNTQNFLSFLGNPSAVGSAVSLGGQGFLNQLGGGQGLPQQAQQAPQTLNPLAPLVQQLMNDRLASNPAPAVDTGSADFSYGAMKPFDPTAPASTQADFQDKTAEEIGFFEGSAAAQGVTPSALGRRTARVTPGGVTAGRGRI